MSSTGPDPTRDAAGRKFDEVASLFGPIVPPAGSPVRPRVLLAPSALPQVSDSELAGEAGPRLVPPAKLRAPPAETLLSMPLAGPRLPPAALSSTTATIVPAATVVPLRPDPKPDAAWAEPKPDVGRVAPARATPAGPGKRLDARAEKATRVEGKTGRAVPWPDAFAPRPNYNRSKKSSLLYWLFLIPFAIVVVVAVTLVDPRSIRAFIDQTLPQYLPAEIVQYFARPAASPDKPQPLPPALLAPAPAAASSTDLSGGAKPPEQPAAPALDAPPVAPSAVAPLAAAPADTVEPQPAHPAAPTAPPPVATSPDAPVSADAPVAGQAAEPPPGPEPVPHAVAEPVAPPTIAAPVMPAAAPAVAAAPAPALPSPGVPAVTNEPSESAAPPPPPPSAPPRVTIYYRRNEAGAEGEARRVATKLGNADIKSSLSTARSPMIYFFNPADREIATAMARSLAGEGSAGWIVRAGPTRPGSGAIDIFLP